MSHPIQALQPVKLPTLPGADTPDQKFWRSFKSPVLINEYSTPTSIYFSPVAPHDFAVTSSTRVQIFSSKTRAVSKTISRFKDTAYSGHIRRDGKLMVAGSASGLMQVFDMNTRAILRTWPEHDRAVQVTKWSPYSLTTVLSASDDSSVRLWDLPSGKVTSMFLGHEDYVRTACFLPNSSSEVVVSGGYDGTVRIWDPRVSANTNKAVMEFTHPDPVESVIGLPGGTTIVAASGPAAYVWDVIAARSLSRLQNHQKTVTSLAISSMDGGSAKRILAGGLDGHVKIFDTKEWKVIHGIKYPSPIISLGVSPEEKHLVVGMVGGLLSIRTRIAGKEKEKEKSLQRTFAAMEAGMPAKTTKPKTSGVLKATRGMDYRGEGEDIIIQNDARKKRTKFRAYEKLLRQGRYADSLDMVLETFKSNPMEIYTLLTALRHRMALKSALMNRDETTIQPILKWLTRHISNPRFVELIVEISLLLLDMYAQAVAQSPIFERSINALREKVNAEVQKSKQACMIKGMVGMLLAIKE